MTTPNANNRIGKRIY